MVSRLSTVICVAACALLTPTAARADVVLDWNRIMVAAVAGQNPFAQARIAAITQIAVFDAINAVTGDYTPYLDRLVAPRDASAEAAAIAAAHRVLRTYLPDQAAMLDAEREAWLARMAADASRDDGIAVGEAAAAAMIALRAADGAGPPEFHVPTSLDPGEWQLTPGCPPAGGVLLHWGRLMPFGVRRADQFRTPPPPPLSSARYARDHEEVKTVGAADTVTRPQSRADVSRFYAAVLAVGTWNPAVSQAAASQHAPQVDNARAFALLNMAISDALVAVMDSKYHYNFWRPEDAIARADEDGNKRTTSARGFIPFVPTPCFPSYPSAHASASYAALEIAERLFGDPESSITLSSPAVPDVTLHYTRFDTIASDIDDARVYGGIHFRFDQQAGARQGRRIGQYIHQRYFTPISARTQTRPGRPPDR